MAGIRKRLLRENTRPPDETEKAFGIRMIYEITECTIDKYGQLFIVPDMELGSYWTNLSLPDQEIIDPYHAQNGSKLYHSKINCTTVCLLTLNV